MNGAEIVVKTLEKLNIKTVFGYPGANVMDIYDALSESPVRHILTASEAGAVHAADGFSRAGGRIGVCIATSGPGAANFVTGLATAYADSSPLIAITGNVPLSLLGTDGFQEVDTTGITMAVTKHNFIVKDVNELSETIVKAYEIALSGRRGPVLVDIPKNIQTEVCDFSFRKPRFSEDKPFSVNEGLKLIKSSSRPCILCGGGVTASDAGEVLQRFADIIDAPVVSSMMGLSGFPHSNPRFLGMMGMYGISEATEAEVEADLIIALGMRFTERTFYGRKPTSAKVLHIDIDPAEINKNVEAYTGIEGNVKAVLEAMCERLTPKKRPKWARRIEEIRSAQKPQCYPQKVIKTAKNLLPCDTPVATDVGQHQMWVAKFYDFEKPRTFISSGGMGTMGFGLGAAIGASEATGKHTVLFTGDGSFLMNMNELSTVSGYNIPVTVIVMNNRALGMVRQWQLSVFGRVSETEPECKPDFKTIAEGFGVKGYRINKKSELKDVFEKAFSENSPSVIDCPIDIDEK